MKRSYPIKKNARFISKNPFRAKTVKARTSRSTLYNLSEVEDSAAAFRIISGLVTKAGQQAAAEARALGLSIVYARGNNLVSISANGEIVSVTPKIRHRPYFTNYKPSAVLHAVKR